MPRKLSNSFLTDLQSGAFHSLLQHVHNDHTLDMEIRNNYINIYYRGGNALKVKEVRNNYVYSFKKNYLVNPVLKGMIPSLSVNTDWAVYFALTKQSMDMYFSMHPKNERAYQQIVVTENNTGKHANATDYFILDIEYTDDAGSRFDLIAVEWPSEASKRKLAGGYKPKLAIVEMKYGDGALSNSSGINKHIQDFTTFMANAVKVNNLRNEMVDVFQQKHQLGLLSGLTAKKNPNKNLITGFSQDIDLIFIIANHDPASQKLINILNPVTGNIKFMRANYAGYGMYFDKMLSLTEFKNTL